MAKKVEKTPLQETKGSFKFIGKVSRIDSEYAFKQAEAERGKRQGDTYRSLRFGVKTSDTNEMTASMYDFEPTEVFLWNSKKKKEDNTYKGERVSFEEWLDNQDAYREEGTTPIQTHVGLHQKEDGKMDIKGMPGFVASKEIFDGFDNGDSVVVSGNVRFSSYENQNGKVIEQTTFGIERIVRIKDIDFEDEKFEEVTYFEQQMVFVDAVAEKKEQKVYVTGRTIDYHKNFHDSEFIVDYSDGEGGTDDGMVKLATAFTKKFAFGDVLTVFGDAINRVIIEENEEEEDEPEDLLASLGGKSKPKHAQNYVSKSYVNEMQITGVEAWDKKVYKETDFEVDELVDKKSSKKDDTEDFGGKKKKDTNPFDDDSGKIEISDDDLPF